ncbi:MAG TPA: FAD-binding oxidoreductase [Blastocatellia bacterium]|nr:FAD-binding oxidoreductase [Blastocatellia bacterium]
MAIPSHHDLEEAIKAWGALLGLENVITEEEALTSVQTATFATTQKVTTIIKPANRQEVQDCVRVAARRGIPIYPISAGKNWGYGSRVPPTDNCAIMALDRLNRILDFDERLAYITVEPGVTFDQVERFLKEKGSRLMVNSPGSTPDASLIGNSLERGIAGGIEGDRWSQVCGLEVVLPDGGCIQTGLERFAKCRASKVIRWGVGPSLDGLFSQSNLGIVTKLTLWLSPLPAFFQYFSFSIKDARQLRTLIDKLQALKRDCVIDTTIGLYNDYKILTYLRQYPWDEADGRTSLSDRLLRKATELLGGVWFGEAAITAPDQRIGEVKRDLLRQALSENVDGLEFKLPNAENPLIGHCTGTGLASVYWRKKSPPPRQMDPDRDGCGLIWLPLVAPFTGQAVTDCMTVIQETMANFAFEPIIGVQCLTPRAVHVVVSIIFDRQQQGQDEAALACHDTMLRRLAQNGFIPYRLSLPAMSTLNTSSEDYGRLLKTIKGALDPAHILAPGRYDFRHEWPK